VPDTFELDTSNEDEEARELSEMVVYAEEIDGPRGRLFGV
jgi:hypothetical protein